MYQKKNVPNALVFAAHMRALIGSFFNIFKTGKIWEVLDLKSFSIQISYGNAQLSGMMRKPAFRICYHTC